MKRDTQKGTQVCLSLYFYYKIYDRERRMLRGRILLLLQTFLLMFCSVWLAQAAEISGVVRDAQSDVIASDNIVIYVYTGDPCDYYEYVTGVGLASDGSYIVSELETGTYYLYADTYGSSFLEGWRVDSSEVSTDCELASAITVAGGEIVSGVDFQLEEGATISGTVLDSADIAIANENERVVYVYEDTDGWNWIGDAYVSSDGTYTISGLPSGTYYLKTEANNSNYIDGWWASSGISNGSDVAESIEVSSGTVNSDIDFRLELGATISGSIADEAGSPVTEGYRYISVYSNSPCNGYYSGWVKDVYSDGETYAIRGLSAGTYYLKVEVHSGSSIGGYWASTGVSNGCIDAEPISVGSGEEISDKNFRLIQGGVISGTIRDTELNAIGGSSSYVEIYRAACNEPDSFGMTLVDFSDGTYTTPGLLAGSYFLKVADYDGEYNGGWWASDGTSNPEELAESIHVSLAETVENHDFIVSASTNGSSTGSTISGSVHGEDGSIVTSGDVELYSGDPCGSYISVDYATIDSSDGAYSIEGVESGTYFLKTYTWENWIDGYWAFAGTSNSCEDAVQITIVNGEDYSDRNFSLAKGSSVSGTVTATSGNVVTSENIYISVYSGDPCGLNTYVSGGGIEDADGHYNVQGLPDGTYFIMMSSYDEPIGYIMGLDTTEGVGGSCEDADTFTVISGGGVSDHDIQLEVGASLSGTFFTESSVPIVEDNIYVQAYTGNPCGDHTYIYADVINNGDGTYKLVGLPSGTYYLQSYGYDSNYYGGWWALNGEANSCESAESLTVQAGTEYHNYNFILKEGSIVEGRVLDENGDLITCDDMSVAIVSGEPCGEYSYVGDAFVEDGMYRVKGLAPGNYYAFVQGNTNYDAWLNDYQPGWWASLGRSNLCSDAEVISVGDKITLSDVNFSLAESGAISGIVRDTDGNPITGGLTVDVYNESPCSSTTTVKTIVSNRYTGEYFVNGLADGTYYLLISDNNGVFTDGWWADGGVSNTCDIAESIVVTLGTESAGNDFILSTPDTDADGIADYIENESDCLDASDADSDDDGLSDGDEDVNHNGVVDSGETNPCNVDTDGDGIQDGTESGVTLADIDEAETDSSVFQPDLDPSTTTNPLLEDSDGDGLTDGDEDPNLNGIVDEGETDPSTYDKKVNIMPSILPLLLEE